ncbi:uncharacterized protein LOC112515707 [Cynara cardunculus var. scolymus]|uniref:uncharacterized protein LOC112515707 n=1 Tax=Cynara cardunculus var. scolymus TaxID=59895 RepID=UPI000D6303FE|nr:uncharacterized protein LOC112515707 [Cynara cardunculus var. scolymus]
MATIRCNGNWVQFNSHENQCFEDQEEEEALSLCDLPTNDQEISTNSKKEDEDDTEDFEFGSCHGGAAALLPENMCNADEVFFQGQILPLRHSVSSDAAEFSRKINRSASMSVVNSRSNRTDPKTIRLSNGYKYKPRTRNQFHSHPSPSPQIRTQSFRTLSHSNPKTSSLWSFLQVGLLKPQEIGLSDLKNRSKRFGSHNSNSSSTSSSMNSTIEQNQNQNQNQNKIENPRKNTKKKQRLLFSGCKCSADSIESTRKETVGKKEKTKKTTTTMTKEDDMFQFHENRKESTMIGDGKQAVSRHRTFEWLKQLSIAAPSEA